MSKVQTTINSLFSDKTRADARDVFSAQSSVEEKWLKLGVSVRGDIKSAAALDKIRPQVLRELIYSNLPDVTVNGQTFAALAVEDYAIPRKGTEAYEKSAAADKELWAAMQDAKATVRGKGSTYYGRVKTYAYDDKYVNPEKAAKAKEKAKKAKAKAAKAKPSQKVAAMITTTIAAVQKMETPDFVVKTVLDALEVAQKAALAGVPAKAKAAK